jgi:hypothetical protein
MITSRVCVFAVLILIIFNINGRAQHEGHKMPATPASTPTPSPSPTPRAGQMPGMSGSTHSSSDAMGSMTNNMTDLVVMKDDEMFIRVGTSQDNLMSMAGMGSGTSWQPASTQMNMLHKQSGDWLLMFHYNFVGGVNSQGGPRGVTKFESANWFMPAAFRRVGKGTLELRGMVSLEPFTFPPGGSPLLFQTGETYKDQPLIDRQHPHDLFMELSTTYTMPVGEHATWFVYAGYPGEPALGPTAFMHRASALENSSAPLGHHLQDQATSVLGLLRQVLLIVG